MARPIDAIYPLTPLQHGMLHHSLSEPGAGLYVEQFVCTLEGELDAQAFEAGWRDVVGATDIFRTLFMRLKQSEPLQVVKSEAVLPFAYSDWSGKDDKAQKAELAKLMAADRSRDFNPMAAPLMRIRLIKLSEERHRFIWSYHHAILDGWSVPIVLEAVLGAYAKRRRGDGPEKASSPRLDYRRYVRWLRDKDTASAKAYWTEHLMGLTEPGLLSREGEGLSQSRQFGSIERELDADWLSAAERTARACGVTFSALCQTAWAGVLARFSGRRDVIVGTVVSGRTSEVPGIGGVPGLFIQTLPVRVRFDKARASASVMQSLQQDVAAAEAHGHLPLADITACAALPPKASLFQSIFAFENYPGHQDIERVSAGYGLHIKEAEAVEETNYPVAVIAVPGEGLSVKLVFDATAIPARMAASLAEGYVAALSALAGAGEGRAPFAETMESAMPSGQVMASAVKDLPQTGYAALIDARADRHAGKGGLAASEIAREGRKLTEVLADAGLRAGDTLAIAAGPARRAAALYAASALGLAVLPWPDKARAPGEDALHGEGVVAATLRRSGEEMEIVRHDGADGGPRHDAGIWYTDRQLPERSGAVFISESALCAGLSDLSSEWGDEAANLSRLFLWAKDDAESLTESLYLAALRGLDLDVVAADGKGALAVPVHEGGKRAVLRLGHGGTEALSREGGLSDLMEAGLAVIALDSQAVEAGMVPPPATRLLLEHRLSALLPPLAASFAAETGSEAQSALPLADIVSGAAAFASDDAGGQAPGFALGELAVAAYGAPVLRTGRAAYDDGKAIRTLRSLRAWTPDRLAEQGARLEAAAGVMPLFAGEMRLPDGQAVRIALFPENAGDLTEAEALFKEGAGTNETVLVGTIERSRWESEGRSSLLSEVFTELSKAEYAPPRTEEERGLHSIWVQLLERDDFGIHDDYFELGGQSLTVTVMLYEAAKTFGVEPTVEDLSSGPTVAQLAGIIARLRSGELDGKRAVRDLRPELVLEPEYIGDMSGAVHGPPFAEVFLTGATGFLGTQILADLCDRTEARVHCLVRAESPEAGAARIEKAMRRYEVWKDAYAVRIVAVPGDLDKPLFGLTPERFEALAGTVEAIYHNGALVNFVLGYDQLVPANVTGTKTIIALASTGRLKPVHYVSTVGTLDRMRPSIEETFTIEWHENLGSGYEQSKWVAERILALAAEKGVPVSIYRPSRIVGHSQSGVLNADDLFCRFLQGIVRLGCAPEGAGWDNMVPVDYVGRLIVDASMRSNSAGQGFHVISPDWHPFDEVIGAVEAKGYEIERAPYGEFLSRLIASAATDPEGPLVPLIPVLQRLNPELDPSIGAKMPIETGRLEALVGGAAIRDIPPASEQCAVFIDRLAADGAMPQPQKRAG